MKISTATNVSELKWSQTFTVGSLHQPARMPLVVVVIGFPQSNICVGDRSAGNRVAEIDQCLLRRRLQHERGVRDQNEISGGNRTALRFKQIRAERQIAVNAHFLAVRFVIAFAVKVLRPGLDRHSSLNWQSMNPVLNVALAFIYLQMFGEADVARQIDSVEREIGARDVACVQRKLKFRPGQEDVRDADVDSWLSNLFDLLLCLIVVASFALHEFFDEATV